MAREELPIPDWVDSEAEPNRGLDLLGLRLPAQAIGNILLSGITTISPTIRYLSIRAWIVRTFELSGLPATWKAIEDFAASIESAVVLGNLLVNPHMPGLVGPDRAHPLVESGADPLPLGRLVVQLAFNTYAGPSEALGLSLTLSSRLPALTSERGKPLADEFEKSVQGTRFRSALAGGPLPESVSRDVLRELGERVRVDAIPPGESALLLNAIMPADPGIVTGANERNRIATYVVLLELADSLKREPQDSDFFQLVARPDSQVSSAVQPILDEWACYAVRDMLAVVHEAAMNAVMDELAARHSESAYIDAGTLIAEMLARTDDINAPLHELGLLAANESYENLSFQELDRRIDRATSPAPGPGGVRRWCGDLTEPFLRRLVAAGSVAVFGLLPVAWLLARRRVDTTQAKGIEMLQALSSQGWSRIGLQQTILPLLQQWSRENRTLPDVVFQLVRRTVEQHLRIAWSRLVTDPTKDVALLIADGDRWFFRKKFRHGRPASRLPETVGWLRQLGFVDQHGITSAGRDVLCRGHRILVDKAPGSSP